MDKFNTNDSIEYPVRINRYLKLQGISSRREADRLIEAGQVLVNGEPAVLGQKIEKDDEVKVSFRAQKKLQDRTYVVFNKPRGVVSVNAQRDEKDFRDFGKFPADIAPVGRLDKDSHGLLFLTNDGRIVNRMLNPEFDHEKEYEVRVNKSVTEQFIKRMSKGVNIEGYMTKPAVVTKTGETTFRIILTEGKKHQIRRMATALGYEVLDLKRTRIMNITLGDLKEGSWRNLSKSEVSTLLKTLLAK